MTDPKDEGPKDLTNIAEYSKKMADTDEMPKLPEGAVMEESKIEKVDAFESLEDYSKANPVPETPQFDVTPPGTMTCITPAPDTIVPDAPPPDAPESGDYSQAITGANIGAGASADGLGEAEKNPAAPPELLAGVDFTAAGAGTPPPEEPVIPPEASMFTRPAQEALEPTRITGAIAKLKHYAENITTGSPPVPASLPFSLLIAGRLTAHEREKLLDIINRENMGFREVDLEPQFEAGRILLPRISEYAGVVVIQALRGANVTMRFDLADRIFATEDTGSDVNAPLEPGIAITETGTADLYSETEHPAERLPLSQLGRIPGLEEYSIIDAITASATLRSAMVEATSSSEYVEIVDALKREVRYKAWRKGATAVLDFKVTLTPLSLHTHYRLTATGSAVKCAQPD